MGGVRACATIFVILVTCQLVAGKPFFSDLLYLLMFDDCDDTTSSTASYESLFDYDTDCGPRRRTTPRPAVQPPGGPISMMIPPANGMNLTMTNTNGAWQMNILPWPGAPVGSGATPAPVTPAAPAATPAPAPAATTAAAATAAAPTTAAAGK